MDYNSFLQSKLPRVESIGPEPGKVHPMLFDWQAQLVRWSVRKGRAALFEDCGLGKTIQQVEWIRLILEHVRAQKGIARSLIVAPLSVAEQTVEESKKLGVEIRFASSPSEEDGIQITNYEKLHKFVGFPYDAIVLDESSILKSLDGRTRTLLLEQFTHIPYRLCCTATPAPNDIVELVNHAEFLGIATAKEIRSQYFSHDNKEGASQGYRLRGHGRQHFWNWIAQWAVWIRKPSDIGFSDEGFELPPLNVSERVIESDYIPEGKLFPDILGGGIQGRIGARNHTLSMRVEEAAEIIKASHEQWLVWHDLNEEGKRLAKLLGDRAILIEGSTKEDRRREGIKRFTSNGSNEVLISKPGMFGFGLNLQNCHNVLYVGLSDSEERWYQSIRRCWRFGQKQPVNVTVVISDAEMSVLENVRRKETNTSALIDGVVTAMKEAQTAEVKGGTRKPMEYQTKNHSTDQFKMILGDCVEQVRTLESNSIDLSVFSPPFAKLYTYSPSERDMGNSRTYGEFWDHFRFLIPDLLRVVKPGRTCVVHCQDLALTKTNDGVIGRKDFSRDISIAFEECGWIYQGRVSIDKNPQAQAIRTKARNLMFVQKNKDSAVSRPALADYLMLFEKPGQNAVPVETDVTNEEWIKYAHSCWTDIDESDTLNARMARDADDEAHLCPLQLEVIRRCVRLWSNPGETILSPFAGIGSEGYISLEQGRKFIGIELKEGYFNQAIKNLSAAVKQESLFAAVAA